MAKNFKKSATTLTTRWLAYDDLDYHLTDYCCENCKVHMATYNIKDFKFCHNCGAKVTEVVSV